MPSAQVFTNYTDEDFTFYWDSTPYEVKAGQSIYLQDYLASHAAKHLVDRELTKAGVPTNTQTERDELLKKVFTDSEKTVVEESPEKLEAKVINENIESGAVEAPRSRKSTKSTNKASKVSDEEFEGLEK